jgi:hypothetical protein
MFVKMVTANNFRRRRAAFIIMGILMLVVGAGGLTLMAIFGLAESDGLISGFYSGAGAGLVIAGIIFIIRYGFILNNPEKRKKEEIDAKDERNRFIVMKSGYIAFFAVMAIQFVGLMAAGIIDAAAFKILTALVLIELPVAIIVYAVVRKTT